MSDRNTDTGGPAKLPVSVLDWFAGRAPKKPQWEFEVMDSRRPKPYFDSEKKEWMNLDEAHDWDLERARRKLERWPYEWAQAQVAEKRRVERAT